MIKKGKRPPQCKNYYVDGQREGEREREKEREKERLQMKAERKMLGRKKEKSRFFSPLLLPHPV